MKTLKVSSIYQARRRGGIVAPHLRLSGTWLARAGFPAGSRVRVQVQEGQLIITTKEAVS